MDIRPSICDGNDTDYHTKICESENENKNVEWAGDQTTTRV
jgi:hypothetical protein